jgi:catechol 2,3-dioxygenase-like lactoylglutathione lyase family enzyme
MTFRIGKNFHIIHMTDDVRVLNLWYYDVFAVRQFMPEGYMAAEKRDASLVLVGELCVEPLAPAFRFEGWQDMPLGRFYREHGERFHSLAWYVDDGMAELYQALRQAEIECRGIGGVRLGDSYVDGPVFTHPRDTLTQLEFIPAPNVPGGPAMLRDPRYEPGWRASWWADYHPLQIQKLSHVTFSTFDLDKALAVYVDRLHGTLLYEAENPALNSRSMFVLLGEDLVIELAQPAGDGPLKADMDRFRSGIYAVAFKVRDLDDARRYLERKGVKVSWSDEPVAFVTDPETTHGVVMGFTTWDVPGDPRPDWTDNPEVLPARLFSASDAPATGT